MLIIISGTSGSGKNTVISELLKRNENIQFLKSCTTRKRRPNESEDSYIFLSKPNFDDKLKMYSSQSESANNSYLQAKNSMFVNELVLINTDAGEKVEKQPYSDYTEYNYIFTNLSKDYSLKSPRKKMRRQSA